MRYLTIGAVLILVAAPRSALPQTPADVNAAIQRGVDYLRSRQLANGNWEDLNDYRGGMAGLAILALLSADVSPDDASVQKGLDYLRTIEPQYTYVVALQTMAFATARPKGFFPLVKRNALWLMNTRLPNGMWEYPGRGGGDNSNTQFALLGLKEASDAGVKIPDAFWQKSREHWIRTQTEVGSWDYTSRGASGSMTAAGVSSLVITGQALHTVREGVYNGQKVRCNGALEDRNVAAGLRWLGNNFSVTQNPGGNSIWLYYYLYGMERAGRLSGRRFLGDHDWYRAGTRYLLKAQRADGSWDNVNAGGVSSLFNTSFALLFLSKGRIPILVNKLRYGAGEDWNNAPNDINNLTQFMSRTWQKKLNWQIVDVRVASVEDLLQAPVLHFNGHQKPTFTDREKKLLRQYVEQGGLLVADANCSVSDFDTGFRALCKELFPEPGQDLRRIEPEHGVWTSLFDLTPLASSWPLYGIDVGCRTGVFYSPEDLSCQWEHQEDLDNPRTTALAQFRIGGNIIAYATGPEQLLDKLTERKVINTGAEDEIRRNFLQLAKIKHNGDWNPAPRAIRNLMGSLREKAKIDVIRQPREIDLLDPNLVNYPLAYMHGRSRFTFDRKEKEMLADYLKTGGVLLSDACCGSERFDEAFRALIAELFPDNKLVPVPLDHELFSESIGYRISEVTLSKAAGGRVGTPQLEGLLIDGRFAVIYSRLDIGCALERQQGSDCKGYTHDSALKIATNVALYALKQ